MKWPLDHCEGGCERRPTLAYGPLSRLIIQLTKKQLAHQKRCRTCRRHGPLACRTDWINEQRIRIEMIRHVSLLDGLWSAWKKDEQRRWKKRRTRRKMKR